MRLPGLLLYILMLKADVVAHKCFMPVISYHITKAPSKYRATPPPKTQNTRLEPAITIKLLSQLYYFIIPYRKFQFSAYLAHYFEITVSLYCSQTLISYNHNFIILLSQVWWFFRNPAQLPNWCWQSVHKKVPADGGVHCWSANHILYQSIADLKVKRLHSE